MKVDNENSVTWRRLILGDTLTRWPDDILIMDVARVGQVNWPIERCILVSDRLETATLIETMIACGAQHFIQSANPRFNHAVNLAAAMIGDPLTFIDKPIESYFAYRTKDYQSISFPFRNSKEKLKTLQQVLDYGRACGVRENMEDVLRGIADELFTNAIYSAPRDLEGRPKYLTTQRNMYVELDANVNAEIFVAHDEQILIIGCIDTYGSLKPQKVAGMLKKCYSSGTNQAMDLSSGGAGFGCFLMMEQSSNFSLMVNPGQKSLIFASILLGLTLKASAIIPKNLHLVTVAKEGIGQDEANAKLIGIFDN